MASEGQPEYEEMDGRIKKTRASHVCQGCRKRKVKCDLVIRGNPCSNCLEDEIECIELESKRTRRYRRQKNESTKATSSVVATLSRSISEDANASASVVAAPSTYFADPDQQIKALCQAGETPHPNDACTLPGNSLQSNQNRIFELPAFVKPMRLDLEPDDAKCLALRGVLNIPEGHARDEIIKAYVLYMHPYVPVFNLQDFFDSLRQVENSKPCSLILLQAVLFSGSAIVDMSVLESLGFQSRRDARRSFYVKVKQLYSLEWEQDPVPVIQSLLLISDWFESPDDQMDPWHWVGVCHRLAIRIGLGNNPLYASNPPKTRSLLKRLWWLCVLRDRILAIALRKPLQFGDDEINMPLVTVEDFETQPIDTGIPSLNDYGILTDSKIRQVLARLCIEKISLSFVSAHILSRNYTLTSSSGVPETSVMLYSPRYTAGFMADEVSLHNKLQQWIKTLPEECVFVEPLPNAAVGRTVDEEVLILHRAALRIFVLITSGLLYRPLLSAKLHSFGEKYLNRQDVKLAVEGVANETARLARLLHEQQLVPKLPPFINALFFSAIPTFIPMIKASTGDLCKELRLKFRWCVEVISLQRDILPTADLGYAMIEGMVVKAQIEDVDDLMRGPLTPSHLSRNYWPLNPELEAGPMEVTSDWLYQVDFDENLFNQICNFSDVSPGDWQ